MIFTFCPQVTLSYPPFLFRLDLLSAAAQKLEIPWFGSQGTIFLLFCELVPCSVFLYQGYHGIYFVSYLYQKRCRVEFLTTFYSKNQQHFLFDQSSFFSGRGSSTADL